MSGPGERVDSPFQTVSETEYDQWDRYRMMIDAGVVAPLKVLLGDARGVFGLATVLIYVLAGTIGVMLIPAPEATGPVLQGPFQSLRYPLGTDRYGKGIFRLIVHATPAMLKMITAGAVFTTLMATIVGTVSGYEGGRVDSALMTISDTVLAVPGLPLIIVLASVFEPKDPFVVGLVISLPAWAGLARALRSEVLSLREESFVEASRINGFSTLSIVRRELIPNLMPYITINAVNSARRVIFSSVALYFLGILGTSILNWGVMMNRAYNSVGALYTLDTAHWLIMPMLAIIWLSFGLIMLGQAADKIFNPRLKARHAESTADDPAVAEP
ncbi:MAG: ABC transporter permease [Halosimplex sp.]